MKATLTSQLFWCHVCLTCTTSKVKSLQCNGRHAYKMQKSSMWYPAMLTVMSKRQKQNKYNQRNSAIKYSFLWHVGTFRLNWYKHFTFICAVLLHAKNGPVHKASCSRLHKPQNQDRTRNSMPQHKCYIAVCLFFSRTDFELFMSYLQQACPISFSVNWISTIRVCRLEETLHMNDKM